MEILFLHHNRQPTFKQKPNRVQSQLVGLWVFVAAAFFPLVPKSAHRCLFFWGGEDAMKGNDGRSVFFDFDPFFGGWVDFGSIAQMMKKNESLKRFSMIHPRHVALMDQQASYLNQGILTHTHTIHIWYMFTYIDPIKISTIHASM